MRRFWLLPMAIALTGCSRAYYRQWADSDSQAVISDRGLPVGNTELLRPPESRLYDPYSAESPPKPPDDPEASRYMNHPGGMRGSKHFYDWGAAEQIEWDGWESTLVRDEKGVVKVDQETAVDLAYLHSREYQSQIETVYTTALTLTLNRFDFQLHWFAQPGTLYSHSGSGGAQVDQVDTLTQISNIGATLNLPAGGQLMAELVNSLAVEFTGTGQTTYGSSFLFTFMQPLLRNAGRLVRLEALTQAERELLYGVRTFARYRKQFWANISTNTYLNLLLQQQGIRNLEANLKSQELNLRFYRELFKGGKASVVDVDQSYNAYEQARQSIIDATVLYEFSLDAYKLQIGLPPRLKFDIDDRLLNQFQLTSKELDDLQEDVEKFQQARYRELNEVPSLASLQTSYKEFAALVKRVAPQVDVVEKELAGWGKQLKRPSNVDAESRRRALEAYEEFSQSMPELKKDLAKLEEDIAAGAKALKEADRKEGWERSLLLVRQAMAITDQLSNTQTRVRIYRIELPVFHETEDNAVAYARENRLDLMTQKARVTDTWRKVQVSANQLKGEANLTMTANVGTDPFHANPLNFAATGSTYTVGLQFDTPLNRYAERNNFRTSLINYQSSRRDYMALCDTIDQSLRQDLRQLEAQKQSFEISRQQVIAASRRVEGARQDVISGARTGSVAVNTINLLNALSDLLTARNNLARNFFSYEQLRIQTLLDMEKLQLDDRGHYRDETPSSGHELPGLSPEKRDGTAGLLPSGVERAGSDPADIRIPAP